ncbi:hypothetical protein CXF85_01970, partial [Colwellia sp. 75C3]|uniref:hypothetical protein n=1 Tax=Colwellia sp. 75C3 TaxID=888425 RepID=UPI000CA74E85
MKQLHMINKSEKLKLEGEKRAGIEQNLLKLLFNGFSSLKFLNNETDEIFAIRDLCELNEYTSVALKNCDDGYDSLTNTAKECFDVLLALKGLENRDLIKREAYFTKLIRPPIITFS